MISREKVIQIMDSIYPSGRCDVLKRTARGAIDMRYSSNIRIFAEIYKQELIRLNRRDNMDSFVNTTDNTSDYRDEIINLTDDEILFRNKIETEQCVGI